MNKLVNKLQYIIPDINFTIGDSFCWSPANNTITYPAVISNPIIGKWSLLHEVSHAILKHTDYSLDIDLLLLEVQAWEKAKEIGKQLDITIDDNHIQDCLDSYRNWLHSRSTCPRCSIVCLQSNPEQYFCHNCSCTWQITSSRFCRPYRLSILTQQKRPNQKQNASFTTFL